MTEKTTGHYVSRNKPAHSALSQDQLNELFVKAGWIGKRSRPVVYIKQAPHIENKHGR